MEYETVRATSNTEEHRGTHVARARRTVGSPVIKFHWDKVRFSAPQAMENWRSILGN